MTPSEVVRELKKAVKEQRKWDAPKRDSEGVVYYDEVLWQDYPFRVEFLEWDGFAPMRARYYVELSETSTMVLESYLERQGNHYREYAKWIERPSQVERMKMRLADKWKDVDDWEKSDIVTLW